MNFNETHVHFSHNYCRIYHNKTSEIFLIVLRVLLYQECLQKFNYILSRNTRDDSVI